MPLEQPFFVGVFVSVMGLVGCAGAAPPNARGVVHQRPEPRFVAQRVPALDAVVAGMPRAAETSIADVARYIAAREPDRRARIKALHDWVADRITYDQREARLVVVVTTAPPELLAAQCRLFPDLCPPPDPSGLPPLTVLPMMRTPTTEDIGDQLAERTFVRRRGVCAHYAMLLHRLGDAIGEDIVYVSGKARTPDGTVGQHAWNLARIDGHYEPLDATWDAGWDDGTKFERRYTDAWLFVPAGEFLSTHYADNPRWRLTGDAAAPAWAKGS
jgi:transglutaminase/protease-like cytokinesis protein 3